MNRIKILIPVLLIVLGILLVGSVFALQLKMTEEDVSVIGGTGVVEYKFDEIGKTEILEWYITEGKITGATIRWTWKDSHYEPKIGKYKAILTLYIKDASGKLVPKDDIVGYFSVDNPSAGYVIFKVTEEQGVVEPKELEAVQIVIIEIKE